jgi:glycosyltransferase involved in cell wall biosynthesis
MMKVSVVIPTKNRSALLGQTIEHIETQTFPRDQYEVIVIDNDSSDDTRGVLEQKSGTYPNVKCGFQEKPGAAATRNAGLRMVSGELVLFVDDDVQAEPELIQRHVEYHEKHPGASVIGAMAIPWGDTTDPFLRYLRDHRILNPYSPSNGPIDFSYYHTCNVSTPANILLELGGFNEAFNVYGMEDIELGYRLEQRGLPMIFAPEAKALHYRFPRYQEFMERCGLAGYSLGQFLSLHPSLKRRFVKGGRFTEFLKALHPLYGGAMVAMSPLITLLTNWEQRRGTVPVTRLTDIHYRWAVRYSFFLGYQRYGKSEKPASQGQRIANVQPSLAKKLFK